MKKPAMIATAVGAAAGLAVIGGLATTVLPEDAPGGPTVAAAAVAPDAVGQRDVLSGDALVAAAEAALDKAQEEDQEVTVAIVDRSGATRLVLKSENAGSQTQDSAEQKAFTSVSFGQPTGELTDGASGDEPNLSDIPGTLFLAGGLPLESDHGPIAGVGVGGAPDGAIDEEIAQAAVDVLEDFEG